MTLDQRRIQYLQNTVHRAPGLLSEMAVRGKQLALALQHCPQSAEARFRRRLMALHLTRWLTNACRGGREGPPVYSHSAVRDECEAICSELQETG